MRIISINSLRDYWEIHPETKLPLSEWYLKVSKAEWESFNDMRADFNSVDYVGNQHYVFYIKGNNYRLIVAAKFTLKLVYIRFVGTYDEYRKIDVSKI